MPDAIADAHTKNLEKLSVLMRVPAQWGRNIKFHNGSSRLGPRPPAGLHHIQRVIRRTIPHTPPHYRTHQPAGNLPIPFSSGRQVPAALFAPSSESHSLQLG